MSKHKYVLRYRMFRITHGISLRELSRASGISAQRISQWELMQSPLTKHAKQVLLEAMEDVLYLRTQNSNGAKNAYHFACSTLFDTVPEVGNG